MFCHTAFQINIYLLPQYELWKVFAGKCYLSLGEAKCSPTGRVRTGNKYPKYLLFRKIWFSKKCRRLTNLVDRDRYFSLHKNRMLLWTSSLHKTYLESHWLFTTLFKIWALDLKKKPNIIRGLRMQNVYIQSKF